MIGDSVLELSTCAINLCLIERGGVQACSKQGPGGGSVETSAEGRGARGPEEPGRPERQLTGEKERNVKNEHGAIHEHKLRAEWLGSAAPASTGLLGPS